MNKLTSALAATRDRDDIDAAIVAIGGTRGMSFRGRTVVSAGADTYVWDCDASLRFDPALGVKEFASIADAEMYARRERAGDAAFRDMVKALSDEAECDAYGRM